MFVGLEVVVMLISADRYSVSIARDISVMMHHGSRTRSELERAKLSMVIVLDINSTIMCSEPTP